MDRPFFGNQRFIAGTIFRIQWVGMSAQPEVYGTRMRGQIVFEK
jgi:hypothetical protein